MCLRGASLILGLQISTMDGHLREALTTPGLHHIVHAPAHRTPIRNRIAREHMSRVHMLLVTSNGAGMGHLTRRAAVALCAAPRADTTLFSLSVALPVTAKLGLSGEYCPSSERQWMPQGHWHGYVRDRLVALARELEIDVIAFDGVAPYPGIGLARMRMPDVAFVWFRRGMWRPGVNTAQLKKAAFFDHIYEPGDLAAAADRGATAERGDALLLPPITMLDAIDPLPRREAAAALGIDPDRRTALVTLGSGRLGDVAAPGEVVLDELLSATDWQICVTKPAVALQHVPIRDRQRIIELRNVYPLVRYFAAFDAAVSAAGYNAVHEFVPAAIPTLYVPNPATTTDDQVARAGQLAVDGLAITAHPQAAAKLTVGVRRLTDESVRRDLAAACRAVPRTIANEVEQRQPPSGSSSWVARSSRGDGAPRSSPLEHGCGPERR